MTDAVQFLTGLNGTLISPTALSGPMPANLRSAADVYSTAQVDSILTGYYTSTETDTLLSAKVSTSALTGAAAASTGVDSYLALKGSTFIKANILATTAKDRGATGDGVATDNTAFDALYANHSEIYIDGATFKITPEINLTEKDVRVILHPDAKFTTAAWDMGPIVKAIGTNPVLAFDALFKTVDTDYDLYQHVVGHSIFMQSSTTGPVVVSLYSNCEVNLSGAYGFGANFGVYMTATGGVGVGLEIDTHVTASGTTATALAIDSVGSFASTQAIIIQPNNASSPFGIGLNFNNASGNNAITTKAIRFTGAGSAEGFIYAPTDMLFTSAEIELPSFIVGPTVAEVGTNGKIRIDANASGSPLISAVGSAAAIAIRYQTKSTADHLFRAGDGLNRLLIKGTTGATYAQFTAGSGGFTIAPAGTDTNADTVITGKGNAGVNILSGDITSKFRVNDTGIGFFATTPVAKKTGWSVDTGTAKRTANATYAGTAEGIYTQATIQTLMDAVRDATQTIKAIKDDFHSTAGYGLLAT